MGAKGVELHSLVKAFPGPKGEEVLAVAGVTLTIHPGEMVTLLGPSGCGKTTTLRMIAGFEMPSSGKILIGEKDITGSAPNQRDTAMVFQSYALFPHMTVAENIAYGLRFRKSTKTETKERVGKIMELVGLSGLEKRQPGRLSGGQQQRVALARALVVEPEVLLFDEPLSNLDAKLREHMREEIRGIQQRLGITAVYVTHDQIEAMALSDRIVVMNKGLIEQEGTPEEVYRRPLTRFVADFVGKVNFLPISKQEKKGRDLLVTVFGAPILLPDRLPSPSAAVLVCRPEGMQLCEEGVIETTVKRATYLGATAEYVLELPNKEPITLTETNPKKLYGLGAKANIALDPHSLHVLPA